MKILQAIHTSVTETLEGSQGYGFVLCSKSLPSHVKEAAQDLTYPDGAGGKAIYSLKRSGEDGSWLMINRTVPAVDYTGRSSYVSHTLAFRLDELMGFLESIESEISSVFEFMTKFKWESSWSNSETSRWIEESEDLDASSLEAFHSSPEESQFSFGPLLAFHYSEDGSQIEPKRAAWQFENLTPDEMLATFHRAWLCLDPWRGTCKYADLLGEPQITLRDSWRYSLTTNVRNDGTDKYQWVVLSANCQIIPNREEITPFSWENLSPEEVKEKVGTNIGHLLVERCLRGPESWAQHNLKEKIKPLQERRNESVMNAKEILRKELEKIIQCVKDETEKATMTCNEAVAPYRQDFDKEGKISEWRHRLAVSEEKTLQKIRENRDSFQKNAEPLLRLINTHDLVADLVCDDVNFDNLQQDFNTSVADYQNARLYALMSESLQASKGSEAKLLSDKEKLEDELLLLRASRAADFASERKKFEDELTSEIKKLEDEFTSEKKKFEDKFISRRKEMEVQISDLTAKNVKITEGKRALEIKLENCNRRLRRTRVIAFLLLVISILCMVFMVYLYRLNQKMKTVNTQVKLQNTVKLGESQLGDDPNTGNGGKDNEKP